MTDTVAPWLSTLFSDVKELLTSDADDWKTWDYAPERLTAPAIAIMLGSPAIEDGATFADMLARLNITLVPSVASNQVSWTKLLQLIETSVVRLLEAGYGIEIVGQPYVLEANNARYIAVDITATKDVQPHYEGD